MKPYQIVCACPIIFVVCTNMITSNQDPNQLWLFLKWRSTKSSLLNSVLWSIANVPLNQIPRELTRASITADVHHREYEIYFYLAIRPGLTSADFVLCPM